MFPQIDLDTIDLSNLNRQFLFQKQHVKRPKALVAKETASNFNPHVKINAIHGNIKEQQYDVDWFKGFDLVMNALDNLGVYHEHLKTVCTAIPIPKSNPRRCRCQKTRKQDVPCGRHTFDREWHCRLHRSSAAY